MNGCPDLFNLYVTRRSITKRNDIRRRPTCAWEWDSRSWTVYLVVSNMLPREPRLQATNVLIALSACQLSCPCYNPAMHTSTTTLFFGPCTNKYLWHKIKHISSLSHPSGSRYLLLAFSIILTIYFNYLLWFSRFTTTIFYVLFCNNYFSSVKN